MKEGAMRRTYISVAMGAVLGVGLAGCDLSSTSQTGASPSASSVQSSPSPQSSPSVSAGNGPAGVVDQYWKALQAGDCTTAYGLTVDPARAKYLSVSNLCKSIQLDSVKSYQIGDVTEQTPSSAMVKVTVVRGSGTKMTPTAVVVLVSGSWRISDFKT